MKLPDRKLFGATGLGLAVVFLTAAVVAAGPGGDPRQTARISPAEARQRLDDFVGRPVDASVSEPVTGARHLAYVLHTEELDAFVDAFDGRPLYIGYTRPSPAPQGAPTGETDAAAIAEGFLADHAVDTVGLEQAARLIDHGAVKIWVVTWQRSMNGALLPDRRVVELDPSSGGVISMTDDRRPYVDPPLPTIAEDEAIRIVASSLGVEREAVRDVVLLVTFDTSTGGQLLVWRLQVGHDTGEYVDAALVDVDAVTGKVTIIGRG